MFQHPWLYEINDTYYKKQKILKKVQKYFFIFPLIDYCCISVRFLAVMIELLNFGTCFMYISPRFKFLSKYKLGGPLAIDIFQTVNAIFSD